MGQDSLKISLSLHRRHHILKPNFSAEIPSLLHSPFSKLRSALPAQLSSPYLRDCPLFVLGNTTSFLAVPAGVTKFTELRSPLQCPFSPLTFTTFTKQHNYRLPGSTRLSHSSSQYDRFTGHLEGKEGLLNAK